MVFLAIPLPPATADIWLSVAGLSVTGIFPVS